MFRTCPTPRRRHKCDVISRRAGRAAASSLRTPEGCSTWLNAPCPPSGATVRW
jgi:hypothetical protein